MGIKFLNLQMIPWCFHLKANHISCMQFEPAEVEELPVPMAMGNIKLIKSDGIVKIYHRPIHVSELMVEFPKHMVCRSDSFYIGQKIPALAQDDQLQLGHNYFLLPKHFFQSVLSFVTIASFAAASSSSSSTNSQSQLPSAAAAVASHNNSFCSSSSRDYSKNAFIKKAASCQPFDIQKTPSGCLRIRVSEEFISQLMMEQGKIKEDEEEEERSGKTRSRVCTTPQLQKDYTQLVAGRQWRPKLETIRESREKRKLSSFGMKRIGARRLKDRINNNNIHLRHPHVSSSSATKPPHTPKDKTIKK